MFTIDSIIDTVSHSTKNLIEQTVKNKTVADTCTKLVDAQAEFANQVVKFASSMYATIPYKFDSKQFKI